MTKDQLEELKQDPIKYKHYLDKKAQYKKRYMDKLRQDPVRYEQYRIKHNSDMKKWRQKHKALNDDMYKNYVKRASTYNKAHPDRVNKANKKCRQKRGSEYIKNYMREYRKQNRNNIKEKESNYKKQIYTTIQKNTIITLLEEYRCYIDEIVKNDKTLQRLHYNNYGVNKIKQRIHTIVEPKLLKCKNIINNKKINKTLSKNLCNTYIKELQTRFN